LFLKKSLSDGLLKLGNKIRVVKLMWSCFFVPADYADSADILRNLREKEKLHMKDSGEAGASPYRL
jgi:hypothetical protein